MPLHYNINIQQHVYGSVSIFTIPGGADIYLDGAKQPNPAPTTITNVDPGWHSYLLIYPGYINSEGIVNIKEGDIYELYVVMEESFDIRQAFIYGFLTSLVAGATLYLLTRDKRSFA